MEWIKKNITEPTRKKIKFALWGALLACLLLSWFAWDNNNGFCASLFYLPKDQCTSHFYKMQCTCNDVVRTFTQEDIEEYRSRGRLSGLNWTDINISLGI
jgi:hypothetical protein